MHIVLSNASLSWGGVHRVTEILARGLQQRGHEVVVFGRPDSMLEERIRNVAPFEGVLRGMDFHPVALWRTARSMKRHHTQVALALMKKDVRLTVLAARALGIPAVIRHNQEQALPRGPQSRFLYGGSLFHVTNADATRQVLLASSQWLVPSRVEVIYNGIDAASYLNAQPIAIDIPDGAVRFGMIANLGMRKGIVELAEAWWRVAEVVPNAHLLIAGKGGAEGKFRGMLDGAPRVHWLGYRSDVPNVLASLDVLVLPSYREGAPNVVLEAMASRVAVIATAVSGTPELVRDGIEARLVPARESAPLAAAMIEFARDNHLRRRFADAGHERVLRDFTLDGMLDNYERLFSRLVGETART